MKRKVIFILADAFRYDYIYKFNLRFFKIMIEKKKYFYVKKVIPSTGFCEIVEYITGKEALEHRMFTQITVRDGWYLLKLSNFLKFLDRAYYNNPLRKIPKIRGIYKSLIDSVINEILRKFISSDVINVRYNIPISFLPFLKAVESKYEYDSFEFGGDSNLFVWMRKKKVSYDIDDFIKHNRVKGTDEDRLNRLEEKIRKKILKDFTLLYIGYGELAHFYGTNHPFVRKKIEEFCERVKKIFNLLKQNYKDFVLIIMGDHGMIDVYKYVNVINVFKKVLREVNKELLLFVDYIYFIDSTLFRVWFRDKKMVKPVQEKLFYYLKGVIEMDNELLSYLGKFRPNYGDIILLLKPGHMFFPDFFNIKPNKGMHGYWNKYPEQFGMLIAIGTGLQKFSLVEKMKLSEVKNFIQTLWE